MSVDTGVLEGNLEQMLAQVQKLRVVRHPGDKRPKIMIALPNKIDMNVHLVRWLLEAARNPDYHVLIHTETEKFFHSYARNLCVKAFLEQTDADWILFIDADVCPPPNALDLCRFGKPIISGSVGCWINGHLMPSIWTRADCEQCRNWKKFDEDGSVIDKGQYIAIENVLCRWIPFASKHQAFYERGKGFINGHECRCKGTGRDPWVFRVDPGIVGLEPFKTDSVGGAMLMIERSVFQKIPYPPFRFLFRENEEILLTEDHYFCWLAQEVGFEVWAHPQCVGQHFKLVDLLGVNHALAEAYKVGKAGNTDGAILTNVR